MPDGGHKLATSARLVAEQLAADFLSRGNFAAVNGAIDTRTLADILPAATVGGVEGFANYGFAGLAVQSVGFTSGAEEEVVHIYVTRGSKRDLGKISADVGDVKVRVFNTGRLVAQQL